MNRLVIGIILCVLSLRAYATTPFPPKVFANDSWAFVAAFAWPDENDNVLIIRTVRKTTLLSMKELGIDDIAEWTTAGSQWYQNSVGYVTSLQIRGMDDKVRHRVFYFRNRDGNETIIDLNTSTQIDPAHVLNRSDLDKMTIKEAANLIQSNMPHDRQTAAIHLGYLGDTEHLPALRNLLDDDASFTQISGKERRTVYFVKEAAERATQLINERKHANKAIDCDEE